MWWNNIDNCDALGGESPAIVYVGRHSYVDGRRCRSI